eukprot:356243-Chlamydomonas_euryale.AAC.3
MRVFMGVLTGTSHVEPCSRASLGPLCATFGKQIDRQCQQARVRPQFVFKPGSTGLACKRNWRSVGGMSSVMRD